MSDPNAPLILAFGDSLTEGYGLARGDSFAAQIETLLRATRRHATVINEGVSGDTTTMALARLPRLLSRLKAKPDLAIVELGANDLIRGISIDRTRANLDAILVELARCDIPVLLAAMEPPAFLGAIGQACSAIYAELARKHDVPVFPFFPAGVLANPALCLRDRIHPNAQGIARIAQAFLPAVEQALRARRRNRAA